MNSPLDIFNNIFLFGCIIHCTAASICMSVIIIIWMVLICGSRCFNTVFTLHYKVHKMNQKAVQMEQNSAYGMVHGEGINCTCRHCVYKNTS